MMRLIPILALLGGFLAAGCSDNSIYGDVAPMAQEEPVPYADPGAAAVKDEIATLPFKHVIWDHRFSKEIARITLGDSDLYLETPDAKVLCVNRFSGATRWEFHIDTGTNCDWPPVEADGVSEEIRLTEAALVAKNREIESMLKTKGPGEETRKLQKERDQLRDNLTVAQFGDNVYFISGGSLYCLVRTTGKLLWTRAMRNFVPSGRPFAIRDYLFVPGADLSRVWALDVKKGKGQDVTYYPTSIGAHDKAVTNQATYAAPLVYFVSHDGKIYSYLVNGTAKWTFSAGDALKADPIVHRWSVPYTDDKGGPKKYDNLFLFVGGLDQSFYAIDGTNGALMWKYETGGQITTPAIAKDATVYVKSDGGSLFALDVTPMHKNKAGAIDAPRSGGEWPWKRNGNLRWKLPLGERFVVKGKSSVYVLGAERTIHQMNEMTGQELGKTPMTLMTHIVTNPLDDVLYVANPAGYVFALRESEEKY